MSLETRPAGMTSSPRTWGCFPVSIDMYREAWVFPTHVGVFLFRKPSNCGRKGLPHARGGVSLGVVLGTTSAPSSPRTWGCFSRVNSSFTRESVFPTHVGVFLPFRSCRAVRRRLPHARGGVSRSGRACPVLALSSPRTWGGRWVFGGKRATLSVFPTHVGGAPSRGCPRKPLPHSWGFSRLPLT